MRSANGAESPEAGSGKAAQLTLGAVTTYSDENYAKQLGASADEYLRFKDSWKQQDAADRNPAGSRIPGLDWLPDGFDLTAALLADGTDAI